MSRLAWTLPLAVAVAACGEPVPLAPADAVVVERVTPLPGASGVVTSATVAVRFSRSMAPGSSAYLDVHQRGIDGPVVPGQWSWSDDRHMATFHPDEPLMHGTVHAIHLGAGVRSADGATLDFEHCLAYGGQWAHGQGGMHRSEGGPHAGPGWMHGNGSYGLMFAFTTG